MDARKWVRWQDWVALVIGVVVALTPLWFDPGTTSGLWMMIVVGALLALSALWSLAMPGMLASEWAHAVIGVGIVVAPWVGAFTAETGAAVTSWIGGALAIIIGLEVILEFSRANRRATQTP